MKALAKKIAFRLLSPFIIRNNQDDSIYITFDDGPHPENTLPIIEVLKKYQIKATFFTVGQYMERYPEIVTEIIAQGHTLGYHSYTHHSLKKQTFSAIRKDFHQVKKLSNRFGYPIKLYRPPYGDLSVIAFFWIVIKGMKIVLWSRDSRDSFDKLPQVIKNVSPEQLLPGDILLFHDDYQHVAQLIDTTFNAYAKNKIDCKPL